MLASQYTILSIITKIHNVMSDLDLRFTVVYSTFHLSKEIQRHVRSRLEVHSCLLYFPFWAKRPFGFTVVCCTFHFEQRDCLGSQLSTVLSILSKKIPFGFIVSKAHFEQVKFTNFWAGGLQTIEHRVNIYKIEHWIIFWSWSSSFTFLIQTTWLEKNCLCFGAQIYFSKLIKI